MKSNQQDAATLLIELQIHQAELEMQNDELRIANEQLELQQLKFTGIYDLAPIGYFILDENGMVSEVNNAGVSLLETGKHNILKHKLQNFVAPGSADTYRRYYRQMLDSGKKQSCHLKMVSKKGTEFYIQMEGITVSPIPNQPLQFDIAIMDITQRVKAEQNLLKTKERLQLALEASAVVTWELEPETMQFYFDELNYRVSTIPGENFDGKYQTFINLVHREDREIVDQHFRTSLNNQTKIDVSCRYINNGGNVCYISIRGHIITGTGQPRRFVGIMMDITEKRRMEKETLLLKHVQQKTIALATSLAEENERKRISDALHDSVSQLLYGIRIKLGSLDAGAHKDVVGHINGLLDLAIHETRNISFELAPSILTDFGLPATIDELAKRLSTPQMQISTRITGFDERLEKQLEIGIFRIIQELVNNCMKHAGASLIFIEIVKSKSIAICVKDNGQGYHPANLNGIPSGSGLSSIKNRISFYNGQLRISSNQGSGTKVDISLEYQTDHEPAFNNNL